MAFNVAVQDTEFRFPCEPNEAVLDAAQRAGFEIPFSCRKDLSPGSRQGRDEPRSGTRLGRFAATPLKNKRIFGYSSSIAGTQCAKETAAKSETLS